MTQDMINWLTISSMILFNILCLSGIFTFLVLTFSISKIKNKFVETMDTTQDTVRDVSKTIEESSSSILIELLVLILGNFWPRKRQNVFSKILKNLK